MSENFPSYPTSSPGPESAGIPSYTGIPQSYPVADLVKAPAPQSIRRAKLALLVIAGLTVVRALVAFANTDATRASLTDADTTLTADQIDLAVTLGLAMGAVVALVIAVLYVLWAIKVAQGRAWARIVAVIFCALTVVTGLTGLASGGLGMVLALLEVVAGIAAIVLLFQRPSNEYLSSPR